jgi:hypothetical protein
MNVEIGAEAALFPEKEYINGIFDAKHSPPSTLVNVGKGRKALSATQRE